MQDEDGRSTPASLSPSERQVLALLHQILSYLDEDEADYHRRMQEVLSRGFTAEYPDVVSADPELSYADCRLVGDLLDMFRVMKASIEKLDEAERAALEADHRDVLRFQGFDRNDAREGKMASYVDHLQERGRWTDLIEDVKAADGGNSHVPMLARYESMLRVLRPMWEEAVSGGMQALLTAEQLRQIAGSRGRP